MSSKNPVFAPPVCLSVRQVVVVSCTVAPGCVCLKETVYMGPTRDTLTSMMVLVLILVLATHYCTLSSGTVMNLTPHLTQIHPHLSKGRNQ